LPLALETPIGPRLGARGPAIAFALVLQALVFGAAHANYPGFPAYSRLVELIVPAMIWGLIFLCFGLLPTVILHALFDLALMALPVFLVEGASAAVNGALVIAAGLVPLAIVLVQRNRAGAWLEFPAALRNAGWSSGATAAKHEDTRAATREGAGRWTLRLQQALPVLALAGIVAYTAAGDYRGDALPLAIDRAQAEAIAEDALKTRGIELGPEWKRLSATRFATQDSNNWLWHKFVWREAGRDAYAALMGSWLAPPVWDVRYARFDSGNVADRADEWRVSIDGAGKVRQVRHTLPEGRPGASLSQEDARKLAQAEITRRFGLDPAALREVSAEQSKRDARTDWQFTWADPRVDVGKGGEARAIVALAGDEVASSGRYVFVPEEWQRAERERASRLQLAKMGVGLIMVILAVAALVAAIVAWSRGRFDRRGFWLATALCATASAIVAANLWPAAQSSFVTAEPYRWQALLWAGSRALSLLLLTLLVSLIAGVGAWTARFHAPAGNSAGNVLLRGIAAGVVVAGCNAIVAAITVRDAPHWPRPGDENAWAPWLSALAEPVTPVLGFIAVTVMILYWLDRLTDGWRRRRVLAFLLLACAAGAKAATSAENGTAIVAVAIVVGALYTLLFAAVIRFDLRVVPGFVAAQVIASVVADGLMQGTSSSHVLAALSCATTLLLAWAATRYLLRAGPSPSTPPRTHSA
jgi:hypothetical protein